MFTSPVSGGRLIFRGLTVVASAEVCTTFRVLMFGEITVVAVSVRDFFHFIPFFTKDDELLLRPFWSPFRLIETSKSFSVILYTA